MIGAGVRINSSAELGERHTDDAILLILQFQFILERIDRSIEESEQLRMRVVLTRARRIGILVCMRIEAAKRYDINAGFQPSGNELGNDLHLIGKGVLVGRWPLA